MQPNNSTSLGIFISYAREDVALEQQLVRHLAPLQKTNLITIFDIDFAIGSDIREWTIENMDNAKIILLLVSSDYLALENTSFEIGYALQKHAAGTAHVLPIILRPCLWQDTPFSDLQVTPKDAKPLSTYTNQDQAFNDIIEDIKRVIKEIVNTTSKSSYSKNKLVQTTIRQGIFEKEAIEKNVTTDVPIQDLAEDRLGFSVYVRALRDFIASQETSTPLTIGIYGPWGSGKSSLMRMVQMQLDPSLSLWKKIRIDWSRIIWLFFFFTTLPAWLYGHFILWIGIKFRTTKHNRFQKIGEGLSYVWSDYNNRTLQGTKPPLKFWQKIGVWHSPIDPPTHPTIWFNAWKFDQEEQLWAALAFEVLDQIKQKYNIFQRLIFWFRLTYKRFSLNSFVKAVAVPFCFGFLSWVYASYTKQLPNFIIPIFGYKIALGQLLLWAGVLISSYVQILKIAKDPFQMEVKNVFDKPNYKDKIGFIGNFEEDFSRIISLITKARFGWRPQKLVIFIDDLDRCEAPKAADIVEGINLFLDSKGCVFVLGMDTAAVEASIETKYKDLFTKLREENVNIISPGKLFLEKIIQVPFHVPPSTKEGIDQLVKAIIQPKTQSVQYASSQVKNTGGGSIINQDSKVLANLSKITPLSAKPAAPDPASYKRDDVSTAIKEGAQFLPVNPRQIKRFVNLFRLYVYIVDARNLLRFGEDNTGKQQNGLTLKRLAIWVAWSMRWPEIIKFLHEEAQLSREELREYLINIADLIDENAYWKDNSCDEVLDELSNKRGEVTSKSHWCYLPWQRWFLEKDFLRCIKEMESFWQQPQLNTSEDDWLDIMLTMSRVTFTPNPNISVDNSDPLARITKKLDSV